jgi:hypothetical protein
MFLQQILQKRLNDLNDEEAKYLGDTNTSFVFEPRKTIGSVRNAKINYPIEHRFFNRTEHMFPKAQKIRDIVIKEVDRDILGTNKIKWNDSSLLPQKVDLKIGESFDKLNEDRRKLLIKTGFCDEQITLTKPQTTYGGCDTRDIYYHGWDVSVEKTPPRDKERQY